MNQRGGVLIMSLWVLVLFTVFALSIAFRTRLALKIQSYEATRFEMQQDAFSGVNLARYFLERDEDGEVDSQEDDWYGTPAGFKETEFSKKFSLKITDEESKLNINQCTPEMLLSVLNVLVRKGLRFETGPKRLAENIMAWRGKSAGFGKSRARNSFKRAAFESFDELLLVPGVSAKDAALLRPYVTVYGQEQDGPAKINLNTVHPYVLEGIIQSFSEGKRQKNVLVRRILKNRAQGDGSMLNLKYFRSEELNPELFIKKLRLENSPSMNALVSKFLFHSQLNSQVFTVEVEKKSPREGFPAPKVEAVLGSFSSRASIIDSKKTMTAVQPPFSNIPELEVLSWRENLS